MKKAILVGITLLPLLIIVSCGVPQQEYDKVSSDLTATQRQIQSLQAEKQALKEKLDESKARIEILNDFVIPSLTGKVQNMTNAEAVNFLLEWGDSIDTIGDPLLTRKFQVLMAAWSDEALDSLYTYLYEDILKTLK